MRHDTKLIKVGGFPVGGGSLISVQSMTNTDTSNIESTVKQIKDLEVAGCDLVRLAINTADDAKALGEIKKRVDLPLIADIQFDYKLGLAAARYGCDCLRINPGNIGSKEKVRNLVTVCKDFGVPIRIGVNSGSLSRKIIDRFGGVNVDSLVASAMEEIETLESLGFYEIKLSIKSSDVPTMIASYKKAAELTSYPLHLGVTEAGPKFNGTIKSAVGIGALLAQGIGDTIRVSLTGDPVDEVRVGKEILKSLGLRKEGINLISCPTCSRTQVDLISIVDKAKEELDKLELNANIAIMGCPVNGPGEAKEADLGVACGKSFALIFKKGEVLRRVDEKEIVSALVEEAKRLRDD